MFKTTKTIITAALLLLTIGLFAQSAKYKAWLQLPDEVLIDSLKKEVPPFKSKDAGPLISFALKNKRGAQISDEKAQSHFKEYLEYFNKLNLYGVDPYELYYKKIDITKLEELKNAGFNLMRIWASSYITTLDNSINSTIVKNPVILFCTIKKGTKDKYEYFEVDEILKDDYSYFKKGDVVNVQMDIDDPNYAESEKKFAEWIGKEYRPSNIVEGDKFVVAIDKYDTDKRYMKNKKDMDFNFDINYTNNRILIRSGKLDFLVFDKSEDCTSLRDFIKRVELFGKINNSTKFYDIKFK